MFDKWAHFAKVLLSTLCRRKITFSGGTIPTYIVIQRLGLINNLMVMILPGMVTTFNMILTRNYFYTIPDSLEESAHIDGASNLVVFFRIMLPYIKPTILTTLLLRVIWVFNSSDMLYVMTDGGPAYSSSTLPLYVFNQAFASLDFGYGSAVGIFIMLLLTIYALIYLKVTKYHEAGDF